LLRQDHENRGRRIFAAHCSSCHRYNGHDGRGYSVEEDPSAPEMAGFASKEWLTKLLNYEHYTSLEYFGGTAFKDGTMAKKVLKKFDQEEQELLPEVALLLSDLANLPYQEPLSEEKRESLMEIFYDDLACIDCHDIDSEGEGSAPDLTEYGSKKWMIDFIINPEHERFYGKKNDRMPCFGRDNKLSSEEIEIVVDWIRSRSAGK
jgi:ubiquinol-cytochrome c reductase cytochrome b subunit